MTGDPYMTISVSLALLLIVLAFGAGLWVSIYIQKERVEYFRKKYIKAALDRQSLLRQERQIAPDALLVPELADGIEHACELFAEGDSEQGQYVIFGLDDRLKTKKAPAISR